MIPSKNPGRRLNMPPPPLPPLPPSTTPRPPTATAQGGSSGAPRRPMSSSSAATAPPDDARYVVYLRLPFPRNGFVDPPPVDWDSTKERNLWKVMSRSARNSELDWNDLADKFNVSVPFLLQQAAWLYERELSQVRAQLRRVGNTALGGTATPTSPTASPNLRDLRTVSASLVKTGGVPMSPSPSRQANMIPASAPSTRVQSTAPPMSRTTSTATTRPVTSQTPLQPINTAFQTPNPQSQTPVPQEQPPLPTTTSPLSQHRQISNEAVQQSGLYRPTSTLRRSASTGSTSSSSSSEASSTDDGNRILPKRRAFRRNDASGSTDALETHEEDESPAFLPWDEGSRAGDGEDNDTSTVVTGGVTRRARPRPRPPGGYEPDRDKNTSGGTIRRGFQQQQQTLQPQQQQQQPKQISPSRTHGNPDSDSSNPGSGSSPRKKPNGEGKRQGGHESSPSMGSSFSDLSDASVTQSALEEQYMSAVGAGGLASRMSTLTNFNPRSRYF